MSSIAMDILLVEDSLEDVELIREALEGSSLDIRLNVVSNGEKALQYLSRVNEYAAVLPPDLIILDLNLPRKSGKDVLTEIKKNDLLKSIPVVVLTTSRSQEDVARCYQEHANCYICKPLDYDNFAEVVKKIEDFWFSVVRLPAGQGGGKQ